MLAVYGGAIGEYRVPDRRGDSGCETQGFVDAGTEVVTGREGGTLVDRLEGWEGAADFIDQLLIGGLVAREVRQGRREDRRGSISF